MRVTATFETTTYKGVNINLAKHEECGWYVETSDGYASEYYKSRTEASAKRKQIKDEIKKGTW
jgi:predicted cupin superfamily sugar epimerase